MKQQSAPDTSFPFESHSFREVAGLTLRPGGTGLTDRALSCCGFAVGARLLDVGCGVGGSVEHLLSRHGLAATGIDPSRTLITQGLARNPDLPLTEGRGDVLPVADEELDGILCECVLSLVDQPDRVLREFFRALRPDGLLILSDLYLRDTTGKPQPVISTEQATAPGPMTRHRLETLLNDSGFTLLLWEDHTRTLQELAARLVLTHGSLDGSWCQAYGAVCSGDRPGYYLLVAQKRRQERLPQ